MSASGTSTVARRQGGTRTIWAIDPERSRVGFTVKNMIFKTVPGHFSEVAGTITLDDADVTHSLVEITVKTASIDTGHPKRDAHLRTADFLDVENIPEMTFKSTRVEEAGPSALRVAGDLTIRGTTRPVTLEVAIGQRGADDRNRETITYTATTRIVRHDFGVSWGPRFMVGGALDLKLSVQATRQQ